MLLGIIIELIVDIILIYDFELILQVVIDKVLLRELIRMFCYGIFLNDMNIFVGTIEYLSFSCYLVFIVKKFKE